MNYYKRAFLFHRLFFYLLRTWKCPFFPFYDHEGYRSVRCVSAEVTYVCERVNDPLCRLQCLEAETEVLFVHIQQRALCLSGYVPFWTFQ